MSKDSLVCETLLPPRGQDFSCFGAPNRGKVRGPYSGKGLMSSREQFDQPISGIRGSALLPVFKHQPGRPAEFGRVMSHQRQSVCQGDGGDHQVVRSDQMAGSVKIRAQIAVLFGRGVVKWHCWELRPQTGDHCPVGRLVGGAATDCPEDQLAEDDGT